MLCNAVVLQLQAEVQSLSQRLGAERLRLTPPTAPAVSPPAMGTRTDSHSDCSRQNLSQELEMEPEDDSEEDGVVVADSHLCSDTDTHTNDDRVMNISRDTDSSEGLQKQEQQQEEKEQVEERAQKHEEEKGRQQQDKEEVRKEGFLMKKGFVNTAFRRRWCVLRCANSQYFVHSFSFIKHATDLSVSACVSLCVCF